MTSNTLFNGGALNKYISDAQISGSFYVLNKKSMSENFPLFKTCLGINATKVFMGSMGFTQHFNYICLSDRVNLASRYK
jgi:hypothetical protein